MQKKMDYAIQADRVTLHLELDTDQGYACEAIGSDGKSAERIGRYAAILIPGKEYTILPASGRIIHSETGVPIVSHIQGNELMQRFSNRSIWRTGQTAAALAKGLSEHVMDEKELVRM